MELPWLDPTTWRGGRNFGLVFTIGLCIGLLLWSLGVVRRNRSQFGLKTVIVGTTLIAVLLAALRVLPPHLPVLTTLAVCSLLMLRDATATPPAPAAFRSGPSRMMIGLAGAMGLGHVIRFVVHGVLKW
jgi:hypothetical protein